MRPARLCPCDLQEGEDSTFRGVFAPQRPAMLRYDRAMHGLSVEPPAESLPAPFGRGCQRLADRSLRSRKSSPFQRIALSMLLFARAVPSEAACFAPHLRGSFFFASLFVHADALSRRASREGRSPRGAQHRRALSLSRHPLFPVPPSDHRIAASAVKALGAVLSLRDCPHHPPRLPP